MVNVNVLNMVGVVILLLQASAFASVENVREEMDEPFPHVCDTTRSGWNQTRCAANHTCCGSKYSGSLMGCCPYPNAVCCSNKLTCCPDNHECVDYRAPGYPGWGVVTTCVPKSTSSRDVSFSTKAATITSEGPQAMTNSTGVCVCKPGPSLPMDPTRKNVVVIGDSVSIGYTPFVAEVLAKKALVQHSPWGGDGGAEETAYGLQCIDYFTRSPSGERVTPDVIMFNWGLHDGPQLSNSLPANVTIPGKEGNMTVYAGQLMQIGQALKNIYAGTKTNLLFAITSPMICKLQADNDVLWLNVQAEAVMKKLGIPTVNLHTAVVNKCGPAPQATCLGVKDCFCPHCASIGYTWIANSTVAPAIESLL